MSMSEGVIITDILFHLQSRIIQLELAYASQGKANFLKGGVQKPPDSPSDPELRRICDLIINYVEDFSRQKYADGSESVKGRVVRKNQSSFEYEISNISKFGKQPFRLNITKMGRTGGSEAKHWLGDAPEIADVLRKLSHTDWDPFFTCPDPELFRVCQLIINYVEDFSRQKYADGSESVQGRVVRKKQCSFEYEILNISKWGKQPFRLNITKTGQAEGYEVMNWLGDAPEIAETLRKLAKTDWDPF